MFSITPISCSSSVPIASCVVAISCVSAWYSSFFRTWLCCVRYFATFSSAVLISISSSFFSISETVILPCRFDGRLLGGDPRLHCGHFAGKIGQLLERGRFSACCRALVVRSTGECLRRPCCGHCAWARNRGQRIASCERHPGKISLPKYPQICLAFAVRYPRRFSFA